MGLPFWESHYKTHLVEDRRRFFFVGSDTAAFEISTSLRKPTLSITREPPIPR